MPSFIPRTLLLAAVALSAPAQAETVWFVVGDADGSRAESYLLPLSEPQDIADARALIAEGPASGVGSIASVLIAPGGDGFNRNVLVEGEPLWSWHVTTFEGFADSAIELCDGWPGFIEEDVAAFIANTGGRVCFWGYTVTAELGQAPVFEINEGIDGAWYDPANPGQGVFIDVLRSHDQVALGWYTYGEGAPVGTGEHLWLTAQGGYTAGHAAMRAYLSTGGSFGQVDGTETEGVANVELRVHDCNHATMDVAFDGGTVVQLPLQRVLTEPGCVR